MKHIPGIINPSDIFNKEMKDNTKYFNLCNSMMFYFRAFPRYRINVPSYIISTEKILPYYSIRSELIVPAELEHQLGVIQTV